VLFDDVDAYHLPFVPYNIEHNQLLSPHQAIHVVQLPKWHRLVTPPDESHVSPLDEIDRWMYFFTEGENLDPDILPDVLRTQEMQHAMQILQQFSESEKNYLLYEQRLEAERVELTRQNELKRAHLEAERAHLEIAQKDQELERERQEKARLLTLLRQAGIDDPQTPDSQ